MISANTARFEAEKALDDAYVMGTFARSGVEFVRGEGMWLYDTLQRRYLDFLAGIAVCSLGHCHPVLTRAIQDQLAKVIHVSNYFYIEHRGEVAQALSELAADGAAPSPFGAGTQWKTFFANSGAEANECALKLARLWARRDGAAGMSAAVVAGERVGEVVSLRRSFHGRTLGTLAATMQDRLQGPFQPLPAGYLAVDANDVAQLEALFAERGSTICAVLLEPLQGESGVNPLDATYVQAARRLCDEYGALLIFDEVQTGIYRTGTPFAFQGVWGEAGVTPDVFTLAKGLGGGVPVGACVARERVADNLRPGEHGSTFGGSALACAAARAVLTELARMDAPEHVTRVGAFLRESLEKVPQVASVRGCGLMVGVELAPSAPEAHKVVARALNEGLIINATGPTTLRLVPPLICEETHVEDAVDLLSRALA